MMFPDFSQAQQYWTGWTRMAAAQLTELERIGSELEKLQGQGIERAQNAIDESARLMKESLAYANQMSAEWRKLGLEMSRQAVGSSTS